MCKKIISFFLFSVSVIIPLHAQTLWLHKGNVSVAYTASADEMPFVNGESLTIGTTTYSLADIDSICVDQTTVADNTVGVTYNGSSAHVVLAGNLVPYITLSVNGAHVSAVQSDNLANEVTYTLQGTSSNGSFWMDGKLKASLVLNALTLTNPDSAAINIRNGKRINVTLADGTTNTLADGSGGAQKGCFMVKGHTEFKGGGTLILSGNTAHAFWGGEYVEMKKSLGTIAIKKAVTDGMNINQYLEVKGGTLNISGVGDDAVQVSKTDDDTDEQNGQVIISGGTLSLATTASASKGIKCEDMFTMSDGTLTATTTGSGMYDSSDSDVAACACIKVGGDATISGGTLTLKSTGTGGKGINCDGALTISDGTVNVTTTGKQYTYSRLTSSPKGIRAEGNITINGGDITMTCSGGEGSEGIESKATIYITEGTIISTCYDDAINAATHIDISGGKIYAYGPNNDGIDSNGTLSISGGLVIANGTNEPEEGFDCDQNTFTITGGTVIGMGGATSTPTSSTTTQPVVILSGNSYTQNQYLTLSDASGNLIFAFKIPRTYSRATLLVSSPSLAVGSTFTFATGATISGGTQWQGYSADCTASGGTTLQSLTLSSVVTSSGSSSNGGGGNPGGNGGGPGGNGGGPGGGGGGRF